MSRDFQRLNKAEGELQLGDGGVPFHHGGVELTEQLLVQQTYWVVLDRIWGRCFGIVSEVNEVVDRWIIWLGRRWKEKENQKEDEEKEGCLLFIDGSLLLRRTQPQNHTKRLHHQQSTSSTLMTPPR